jgi:hypothetical protein
MSLFDRFRRDPPARTLGEDRPLSADERALAERLLREFAPPEAAAYLPQLDHARVTGRCRCGCPTVDLMVPSELQVASPCPERPLADAFGRVNGKLVGIMLFQSGGLLCLLETYRLEDFSEDPFGLPAIDTIEPCVWSNDGEDSQTGQ